MKILCISIAHTANKDTFDLEGVLRCKCGFTKKVSQKFFHKKVSQKKCHKKVSHTEQKVAHTDLKWVFEADEDVDAFAEQIYYITYREPTYLLLEKGNDITGGGKQGISLAIAWILLFNSPTLRISG